jgi:hypothetical protein
MALTIAGLVNFKALVLATIFINVPKSVFLYLALAAIAAAAVAAAAVAAAAVAADVKKQC